MFSSTQPLVMRTLARSLHPEPVGRASSTAARLATASKQLLSARAAADDRVRRELGR